MKECYNARLVDGFDIKFVNLRFSKIYSSVSFPGCLIVLIALLISVVLRDNGNGPV